MMQFKYRIYTFIVMLFFLASCKQEQDQKEDLTLKVNTFMNAWHASAADADFESYFNKIDGFYIGTDASENWTKEAFATFSKPYFNKKTTWNFKTMSRNIYFSKDKSVIWFDELLTTWMGVCRGSGVLEKEKNEWKIKHYVLSLTVPNDKMKQVIKINKGN
ncbi:MAG: nuclear transport factor 2 family protein [Flavobacteriaceae bacterium]